jgi:hypothetical protein
MESTFLPLLIIAAGLYFGVRNLRMLRSEILLRDYIEASPQAAMWVRKYGVDGTMKLARETFLPLGIVVSVGFIGYGAWLLWNIHS